MNCERDAEKFDLNKLTVKERVVLKPALTFLQMGATFYLSELLKPYLLPIFLVSVAVVLVMVLKSRKQPEEYTAYGSSDSLLVSILPEPNSWTGEFSRTNRTMSRQCGGTTVSARSIQ